MNIFLLIIAFFIYTNRNILGKDSILHQTYSLQSNKNNHGISMSHYIIAKDDLVNVDSKNKDDKNLWYFRSPPIKITIDKTNGKPMLLTFTLTSFMGDFRKLNRCSALIKIIDANGGTIYYPYMTKYDGSMVSFNIPLRNDLWHSEDANEDANFDTIFEDKFAIEILGDWTQGVEVIGLDNVQII